MVEPFTLTALGAVAATEGIKFLYGQASEVLKRWRERKAGDEAAAATPIAVNPVASEKLLAGKLEEPRVDFDALERLHEGIRDAAKELSDYAGGLEDPDPDDEQLARTLDTLRRALEVVYRQRITFKGEDRPPSGPAVIAGAQVDEVEGRLTNLRARRIAGGNVDARLEVKKIEKSGEVTNLDVDTIG